jgi:hypothetical protein
MMFRNPFFASQTAQNISHIRAVCRFGNGERAGVRIHVPGDAIRNNRGNQGIDFSGDGPRDGHRSRNIRAIVNHPVRLERAGGEQDRVDGRRNYLPEFHPIDLFKLTRGKTALCIALAHSDHRGKNEDKE